MGCINSTIKMGELRGSVGALRGGGGGGGAGGSVGGGSGVVDANGVVLPIGNVLRVRVVRLHPEMAVARNGHLELNQRELIFFPRGGNSTPVVWALNHLRRYGLNGDTFSFEAGRRCVSGAGIYTFRSSQAERLYQLFQRYINEVPQFTENMFHAARAVAEHPSITMGRQLANTNTYLEPSIAGRGRGSRILESLSSSTLSPDMNSSEAGPSLPLAANEMVQLNQAQSQQLPGYTNQMQRSATEEGNIYMDLPLPPEHNNSKSSVSSYSAAAETGAGEGNKSTASTLSHKRGMRRSSMEISTNECAPMLMRELPLHLYANVEGLGENCMVLNAAERCYENVCLTDFPLMLQLTTTLATTPGSTVGTQVPMAAIADPESVSLGSGGGASIGGAAAAGVNYIMLDLDQPRSPGTLGSQCSPKTPFGSGFSISATNTDADESLALNSAPTPTKTNTSSTSAVSAVSGATASHVLERQTTVDREQQQQQAPALSQKMISIPDGEVESTLDYCTIDFVKTCALIKSSTHDNDFDQDPDLDIAEEESRITRHSKCVRKAYSISE